MNSVIKLLILVPFRSLEDSAWAESDVNCYSFPKDQLPVHSLKDGDIAKWLYFNKEEFSEVCRSDLFISCCDREQLVDNDNRNKASITYNPMVFCKGNVKHHLIQGITLEESNEKRFNAL